MKAAAVVVSALILVGFYFVQWSAQWADLQGYRSVSLEIQARLAGNPAREAAIPKLEAEVKALVARRREAETRLKLRTDPPAKQLQAHLETEWAPLLKRPGLTVKLKGSSELSEPWVEYELTVEGPKDEVFRLFDGLLRAPRPVGFDRLELKCDASRAQATATLLVYHP